jgi:hypothetical protein
MGQDVIACCHIADPHTRLKAFGNDPSLELSRPPPLASPPRFDNLTPPHKTTATVRHAQPPSAQADLLAGAAGVRNSSIQWGVAAAYIGKVRARKRLPNSGNIVNLYGPDLAI